LVTPYPKVSKSSIHPILSSSLKARARFKN
jgi:hypothetical protein